MLVLYLIAAQAQAMDLEHRACPDTINTVEARIRSQRREESDWNLSSTDSSRAPSAPSSMKSATLLSRKKDTKKKVGEEAKENGVDEEMVGFVRNEDDKEAVDPSTGAARPKVNMKVQTAERDGKGDSFTGGSDCTGRTHICYLRLTCMAAAEGKLKSKKKVHLTLRVDDLRSRNAWVHSLLCAGVRFYRWGSERARLSISDTKKL